MKLFDRKRKMTEAEKQQAADMAERVKYVVDDEAVAEGFRRAVMRIEQEMLDLLRVEELPEVTRVYELRSDYQALQRLKGGFQALINDGHMSVVKRQSQIGQ